MKDPSDRLRPGSASNRRRSLAFDNTEQISDDQLLGLFHRKPQRAWRAFLDRYADRIIGQLRGLGFERDEAMDRFVWVCERLARDDFRRLREVRSTGRQGELVPWLRQVVRNAAIEWGWSKTGRRRLFRSVERLDELDQSVFRHHFWSGLPPAAIVEALQAEGHSDCGPPQVYEALERILRHLDAGQRWRLLSQLARRRQPQQLEATADDGGATWEPVGREPNPEALLLAAERIRSVSEAIRQLPAEDRLVFKLRYEDALTLADISAITSRGLTTVKASLRRSRKLLQVSLEEVDR
ncbi:MAG: sigma-70 family RNA polymerase sigma factor [Acidobacteriota bacterium]